MNHRLDVLCPHICVEVGEGELAAEEKEKIVKELVQSKPALFLQRFGRFLRFTHLTFMCAMQREHPNKGWGDGYKIEKELRVVSGMGVISNKKIQLYAFQNFTLFKILRANCNMPLE